MEFGDESNSRSIGPLTISWCKMGWPGYGIKHWMTWRRIRGGMQQDCKSVKGIRCVNLGKIGF